MEESQWDKATQKHGKVKAYIPLLHLFEPLFQKPYKNNICTSTNNSRYGVWLRIPNLFKSQHQLAKCTVFYQTIFHNHSLIIYLPITSSIWKALSLFLQYLNKHGIYTKYFSNVTTLNLIHCIILMNKFHVTLWTFLSLLFCPSKVF